MPSPRRICSCTPPPRSASRRAHCLVIEDSVNGVLAARAAGMGVWGFLGGGHMDEAAGARLMNAGAERLVADWREAMGLFSGL